MSVEKYMMGSCHHLAVAMHRLTGWDLGAVVGMHRGEVSIMHVFCTDGEGRAWDVRGSQDPSDLTGEQEAMDGCDCWIVSLAGEPDIWRLSGSGEDAKLYPIHESHVLDALSLMEDIVGVDTPYVSDGWSPKDPAANARAARREGEMPDLSRPEPASVPRR